MTIKERDPADESAALIEGVVNHTLPYSSHRLVEAYDEIVGDREQFLWKWAHHLFPKFTLSSVDTQDRTDLDEAKLVGLMFVSILDDVAEMHNDRATFEEAAKIPFDAHSVNHDRPGIDHDVLSFATRVWDQFAPVLEDGPRAQEFEDIVRYDLKQVLNAMDYSSITNQNLEFITSSEVETYDAHNMMLFVFADIDLVHSPSFDKAELSALRQVIEHGQRMVRIGNWITTWEREIAEGDFSSGVVAYALENDIVSVAELRASRNATGDEAAERIVAEIRKQDVEGVFLRRWREELLAAREFEGQFDSVDVKSYLDGLETVMDYHLASRGLK